MIMPPTHSRSQHILWITPSWGNRLYPARRHYNSIHRDFRLHGRNGDATRDFVKKAKDASILITEGTRAGRNDSPDNGTTSEKSVCEVCRDKVGSASGLIIADFSARNFERLESFQNIAEKMGRELVVPAKDIYMLQALACIDNACKMDSLRVYSEIGNKSRKWEQEVVQPLFFDQYVNMKRYERIPITLFSAFHSSI